MLLNFREEHVDVVATVLFPVLKDGFTFIKEQQGIMDLRFPTGSARLQSTAKHLANSTYTSYRPRH